MSQLQVLKLQGCTIWDSSLELIANSCNMDRLEVLDLSYCRGITDKGIAAIAQSSNMARLAILKLTQGTSASTRLTDTALISIAESPYLKKIRELTFIGKITNIGLIAIAKSVNMAQLEHLSIGGTIDLDNTAHLFPKLELGEEQGDCKLTEASAKAIVNSPCLKKLKVFHVENSTLPDSFICTLGAGSETTHLQGLSFEKCPSLTDEGVQAFAASPLMKNLVSLRFIRCKKITESLAKEISQRVLDARRIML